MRHLGAVLMVVAIVAGCGRKQPEDKVTYVAPDDPRMNAAMAKARATVSTFITALKAPKANQSDFAVKMAFTDRNGTEHMWLNPVVYDGKSFHGTINNDPQNVKNVKDGQSVSVEPAKISDWMFVENGKLVGGYTIRVLRDTMSAGERAEFDKSAGFVID
jgi:uncharacterized protein YegJ (DUF2314 family)